MGCGQQLLVFPKPTIAQHGPVLTGEFVQCSLRPLGHFFVAARYTVQVGRYVKGRHGSARALLADGHIEMQIANQRIRFQHQVQQRKPLLAQIALVQMPPKILRNRLAAPPHFEQNALARAIGFDANDLIIIPLRPQSFLYSILGENRLKRLELIQE